LYSVMPCGILIWNGNYDSNTGLNIDNQYMDALIL
jgi:hypothetical protein